MQCGQGPALAWTSQHDVPAQVSIRLVGLALSYTLQLAGLLQWAVRQTAEAENEIVSVERILDYTKLPQEAPTVAAGGAAQPKCVFKFVHNLFLFHFKGRALRILRPKLQSKHYCQYIRNCSGHMRAT